MKICQACGHRFESTGYQCPSCNFLPKTIAGFLSFAPELADASTGYKATHFADLQPLEEKNFWFRSRNRLLLWALGKYFPDKETFLEIGCGTGFVLSGIEHTFSGFRLYGSEIHSAGLHFAQDRVRRCELFQMDAKDIPFEREFDVIGAFDVLEHIIEDEMVLCQMHRAVRFGGGIILSVPQHPLLWSEADEHACHVRRYRARDLKEKVQQAGFTLVRVTSFVTLLLPLMIASRLRPRTPDRDRDPLAELRIGGLANQILEKVLDLERASIRLGLSYPAGGSLLVIARKDKPD